VTRPRRLDFSRHRCENLKCRDGLPSIRCVTQIYNCCDNILLVIGVIPISKMMFLEHWTKTHDTAKIFRLTTGWTVRGSNTGGAIFSRPIQTGSGTPLASCAKGTGSLSRGLSRRSATLPLHRSSVEIKERLKLCFYSPFGVSWPVPG